MVRTAANMQWIGRELSVQDALLRWMDHVQYIDTLDYFIWIYMRIIKKNIFQIIYSRNTYPPFSMVSNNWCKSRWLKNIFLRRNGCKGSSRPVLILTIFLNFTRRSSLRFKIKVTYEMKVENTKFEMKKWQATIFMHTYPISLLPNWSTNLL